MMPSFEGFRNQQRPFVKWRYTQRTAMHTTSLVYHSEGTTQMQPNWTPHCSDGLQGSQVMNLAGFVYYIDQNGSYKYHGSSDCSSRPAVESREEDGRTHLRIS